MKVHPREIYNLLLSSSQTDAIVREIMIGLTWAYCQAEGIGLCMSSRQPTRTLPWSGSLVKMAIANLAAWLKSWDSYQATGVSVTNPEALRQTIAEGEGSSIFDTGVQYRVLKFPV